MAASEGDTHARKHTEAMNTLGKKHFKRFAHSVTLHTHTHTMVLKGQGETPH